MDQVKRSHARKATQIIADQAPGDELFIHLDLAGLLALMRATEAAIAAGRGRLELGSASGGIVVSSGAAPFDR